MSAPNRVPWPPLVLGAVIATAFLFERHYPAQIPGRTSRRAVGMVVIAAGLGLDLSAMIVMARHRANILPHRAATALVTSGPFSFSRNPIYLGNAITTVGLALVTGTAWLLVAAVIEIVLVTKLAITKEEAHLEAVFGREFEEYRQRTHRWVGRRREAPPSSRT